MSKAVLPDGTKIGKVGARLATIGDAATAADYITVCHATPDVTSDIVTAAAADGCPPLDKNATLHTGSGPGARSITEVSKQTGAVAATKAVTSDARGGAGGEEFGIRIDSRVTAVPTTDSVADARREWSAPRRGR